MTRGRRTPVPTRYRYREYALSMLLGSRNRIFLIWLWYSTWLCVRRTILIKMALFSQIVG